MDPIQEELVNWLSPKRDGRAETTTAIGTAMSDSEAGSVLVKLDLSVLADDDISTGEDQTVIELPTTVYCEKGDTVIITLFGADGVMKPTFTGVSGGGDKLNDRVAYIVGGSRDCQGVLFIADLGAAAFGQRVKLGEEVFGCNLHDKAPLTLM